MLLLVIVGHAVAVYFAFAITAAAFAAVANQYVQHHLIP